MADNSARHIREKTEAKYSGAEEPLPYREVFDNWLTAVVVSDRAPVSADFSRFMVTFTLNDTPLSVTVEVTDKELMEHPSCSELVLARALSRAITDRLLVEMERTNATKR